MPVIPPSHETSIVADYIRANCVFRSPQQRLISRRGGVLDWLIDLRSALLRPHILEAITSAFWAKYRFALPFQIGGMEVAAIPLVTALTLKGHQLGLDVNGFIIRKERKTNGRGRNIEGTINDTPIMLVDDTTNSGSSFAKALAVLEAEGHRVWHLFCVIDYRAPKGIAWREFHGLTSDCMFELSTFDLSLKKAPPARYAPRYRPLWRFAAHGASPYSVVPKSTPAYHNGALFVGSDVGAIFSVSAVDGTQKWRRILLNTGRKGIWSSPCLYGGNLYVGAYNGNVYCLDQADGRIIWCCHACEWVGSSPVVVPRHGLISIGLEYEQPSAKGGIAAYTLDEGRKVWEYRLTQYQHGSGVYFDECDSIITGTNDHNVISLDASTGRHLWTFTTRRSVKYAPALDEARGLVSFASFDTSIYILDAHTGEKKAEIKTDDLCYTTPLMLQDRMFCGSGDKHLHVIDLNSFECIARLNLGGRVYASPRLVNGRVLVGTSGGILHIINPASLVIEEKIYLPDAITNAVAVNDDDTRIFIPTYMNQIYCYERIP
jgi:outer membrane protein assembly factor BamB/orotate phosphoribosyltransferase